MTKKQQIVGTQNPMPQDLPAPISNCARLVEGNSQPIEIRHMHGLEIIRFPELMRITGMKKSSLWNIQNPNHKSFLACFPAKRSLSMNCVGWFRHEVEAWLAQRPKNAA